MREFVDMGFNAPGATASDSFGIAATIKSLGKLDPTYRKEFLAEVTVAAQGAINDARARYPATVLSGMARKWTPTSKGGYSSAGGKAFPWDAAKVVGAVRGAARTVPDVETMIASLAAEAREGDHVVFMSNGGFEDAPRRFLAALRG